jgi:diguanylate cyclase (GGDEF)-like protein
VFAPLVVLTAIFAAVVILLLGSDQIPPRLSSILIIAGIAIYASAVALLGEFGLSRLAELEKLGLTDSLSQLPNRRALHLDAQRHAVQGEELGIALIDLDGFKVVNDAYGRNVGDKLIKQCAEILSEVCGEDARFYRLGGNEFAMLVMGPVAGTILEGICRALIERLKRPMVVEDRRLAVGASIGLSRSNGSDNLTSSELLRRSDVAMNASKHGGKMRCTWYSEAFDRNREALREMDEDLRRALANDAFELNYQPLVDTRTKQVVAVESLLRWPRPDGKEIAPNVFIPVAEESGLINQIGLWVLRQACTDAIEWSDIKLSVNISAAQLRNPDFPVQLGIILEETGFPPARLELEVTETCLVLDPVVAARSLDMIRSFGVNVVLDDFGTGYASIGFLRQFRFEKLKLDRSLVVSAGQDDGSRAMMLSSITIARALNMNVTAEGVETEQQADLVSTAGCDQIQGWLYFKALPPDQIAQHLGKRIDPQEEYRRGAKAA